MTRRRPARRACLALLAGLLVGLLAPAMAGAQVETIRTPLAPQATRAELGAQHREAISAASAASLQGRLAEARASLAPVVRWCDRLAESGRKAVAVATAAEYAHYVESEGNGAPVDWIDISCPLAYKGLAFLDIEERAPERALAHLTRAQAMGPYIATIGAERAYLLNQLGRPREALQAYREALALVERFPSNAHGKALVLRGLGYTHIELGEWDDAERMYRLSLEVEPGNPVAQGELAHIAARRAAPDPGGD